MSTLENIIKEMERVEQLKRQKKAKDIRENNRTKKIDTRRLIIIGGFVLKYFPEVINFQPRRTNAENSIEFMALENALKLLSADKQYLDQLKEKANHIPP